MSKEYKIGIDVGGTKMAAVLFDGKRIVADYVLATPKDNLDHFLVMMKALIEPLEERAKHDKAIIVGIGLGVAGVMDFDCEKMLNSPNILILNGVKLRNKVGDMLGYKVVMDNDTNCFLRAEVKQGAAQKYDNVYGVIIGTGVGGALWINDDIYRGANGGAGEPESMIIDMTSGLNLEQSYQKLTQGNTANLAAEAYAGDVLANKVFDEIGIIFGVAFANIVNIVDPQAIIVGGGAIGAGDLFLDQIRKVMKENINSIDTAKKIKVLKSKVEMAGAVGAALLIE